MKPNTLREIESSGSPEQEWNTSRSRGTMPDRCGSNIQYMNLYWKCCQRCAQNHSLHLFSNCVHSALSCPQFDLSRTLLLYLPAQCVMLQCTVHHWRHSTLRLGGRKEGKQYEWTLQYPRACSVRLGLRADLLDDSSANCCSLSSHICCSNSILPVSVLDPLNNFEWEIWTRAPRSAPACFRS